MLDVLQTMLRSQRDDVVTVRLTRDERRMISTLAEVDGISLSDVVRMLVRRAHAERFGRKKVRRA